MSPARSWSRTRALTVVALFAAVLAATLILLAVRAEEASGAGRLPAGFTQTRLAGGLSQPTTMAMAPDGRIFVALQGGRIRIVEKGRVLDPPAIDLSKRIDTRAERGLLGIAFDPGFRGNGWIYLHYTQQAQGNVPAHNQVSRFRVSGDRLLASSERRILRLNNLEAANHNGGAIRFRQDGKLYVAVGDDANSENSQTLRNLKGKMLRINKDGTIPTDNPFYSRTSGVNRAIWALGLRNPYTFAIQPGSGRIFINDVGQLSWEEINAGRRGANYGWPRYEGPESAVQYTSPVFAYRHGNSSSTGCAITGGAFYNPRIVTYPRIFVGDYFFADFCSGWIRRYDSRTDTVRNFASGIGRPVDLMVGNGGSLHYLERESGSVYRIEHPG